ncbi:hypothetical protein HMPREF1408_00657 [Helicobacter pylori GAM245Ai]|nr:hypothetical protein HMPREF1408_00657 [Helicobacter pylori GAM245Ai]
MKIDKTLKTLKIKKLIGGDFCFSSQNRAKSLKSFELNNR